MGGCDDFSIHNFNWNWCCGDCFVNAQGGVGDVVAGGAGVCNRVGGRRKRKGTKRSVCLCN